MSDVVIVGLISLIGTMVGTFGGIMTSSKLTQYRIQQLEEKVDKHNSFAERIPVMEQRIKTCEHRIEDLEKESKYE